MDGDWISITEAAARLTGSGDRVDRSTLSRYLKQHAEALPKRPDGKANLVEFEALAAHRSENIRIRAMPAEVRPAAPGRLAAPAATRFAGSQSDGAARKAQADAAIREMDLAERLSKTTLVSEVDRAGRDAIALMQAAFDRAYEGEAASLSLKYGWDERMVRVALKSFARVGTDIFNREIMKRIDAMKRPKAGLIAEEEIAEPSAVGEP
ncbi:hypothetical protein [Bosea sp. ANAM02]|uniref:hypothetical protein n=1 Tax=Bosea sp. ANAM02 TaxID=2020412 RepID=UPI00140F3C66|nr:hypothetical protein [Bosea sp. ANAM02]BCB18047.1 hypothetical protein OCUBac02_09410 [Bosea sp. ANAM02]